VKNVEHPYFGPFCAQKFGCEFCYRIRLGALIDSKLETFLYMQKTLSSPQSSIVFLCYSSRWLQRMIK